MPSSFVDLTFNLTNNDGKLLPENELFNYLISFRNDDIIDAFWLAIQFTHGHQKPGGLSRSAKKKRKTVKKYNWMSGSRI